MINIKSSKKTYKVIFSKKYNYITKNNNYFYIVDNYFYKKKISSLILPKKRTIFINASENSKSYENITYIICKLINRKIDKSSTIVAIGGGITQDISSFISYILYRGINWIFVPTTLLSQGDSCIGSKIAINFMSIKNLLGGYWPPNKVILDNTFLKTLTRDQIYSGLGEIAHYYYLSNNKNFNYFKKNLMNMKKSFELDYDEIIKKSLQIKKYFIEKDEFEKKERIYLNYGHTFAHALEAISNFKIPHGIAVSMGMHIANYISFRSGYIKKSELISYQLPLEIIFNDYKSFKFSPSILLKKMLQDKKVINNKAKIIILKKIGAPAIKEFKKNTSLLTLITDYKKYTGKI